MLPEDLLATLHRNPDGLKLGARFEDGHGLNPVTFYSADSIPTVTLYVCVDEYIENYGETATGVGLYYGVTAFDLIRDVPGYTSLGVLVWIPEINEYATFDDDHGVLRSFPVFHGTTLLIRLKNTLTPVGIPSELKTIW